MPLWRKALYLAIALAIFGASIAVIGAVRDATARTPAIGSKQITLTIPPGTPEDSWAYQACLNLASRKDGFGFAPEVCEPLIP